MIKDYCIAIRTLGKSGDKFQKEIQSICKQTIKPKRILVYIAKGYDVPYDPSGEVVFVPCAKGMVAQRALSFDEVDTELCLFLDDDVELEPDSIEKMLSAMDMVSADCVVADTFQDQDMSMIGKIKAALVNWVFPYFGSVWAFKVHMTNSFSYNNNPKNKLYKSQSGAGPCSLWRMNALKSIHYEDEKWLDSLGFAYGDDLLQFHKLYRNGGSLYVLYDSGVKHLDAKTSSDLFRSDPKRFEKRAMIKYILWRRIWWDANDLQTVNKIESIIINLVKSIWDLMVHAMASVVSCSISPLIGFVKGTLKGIEFTKSNEYCRLFNYIRD